MHMHWVRSHSERHKDRAIQSSVAGRARATPTFWEALVLELKGSTAELGPSYSQQRLVINLVIQLKFSIRLYLYVT
jgi:hypothetical protein